MRVLRSKCVTEALCAYLVDLEGGGLGVAIQRAGDVADWSGIAVFPRALAGEAASRFADLDSDIEAENLLREWSDPAVLASFTTFMQRGVAVQSPGEEFVPPKGAYGHDGGPT
jgi:hypothetical protein